MNLHEYQAKELLKKFDLPILKGKYYIDQLEGIEGDLKQLKGPPWVVKSQIHAGGRGAGYFQNSFNNKGGVQVVSEKEKVHLVARSMMGNILITKQTGTKGKKVRRIFIEEGCLIDREFFLSILIDRDNSQLMMMISDEGGTDIEGVAESNPNKINNIYFPELKNIFLPIILMEKLSINSDQFGQLEKIIKKLVDAFLSLDATLIEINPLVINREGNFVLLDAKISLDDNALFRHSELEKLIVSVSDADKKDGGEGAIIIKLKSL